MVVYHKSNVRRVLILVSMLKSLNHKLALTIVKTSVGYNCKDVFNAEV